MSSKGDHKNIQEFFPSLKKTNPTSEDHLLIDKKKCDRPPASKLINKFNSLKAPSEMFPSTKVVAIIDDDSEIQHIRNSQSSNALDSETSDGEAPGKTCSQRGGTQSHNFVYGSSDSGNDCDNSDDEDFLPIPITKKPKHKKPSNSLNASKKSNKHVKEKANFGNAFAFMMKKRKSEREVLIESTKDNQLLSNFSQSSDLDVILIGNDNKENEKSSTKKVELNGNFGLPGKCVKTISTDTGVEGTANSINSDTPHNDQTLTHKRCCKKGDIPIGNDEQTPSLSHSSMISEPVKDGKVSAVNASATTNKNPSCNVSNSELFSTIKKSDAFSVLMANRNKKVSFDIQNESDSSLEELTSQSLETPKKTITDFFLKSSLPKKSLNLIQVKSGIQVKIENNTPGNASIKKINTEHLNTLSENCDKKISSPRDKKFPSVAAVKVESNSLVSIKSNLSTNVLDSSMEDFEVKHLKVVGSINHDGESLFGSDSQDKSINASRNVLIKISTEKNHENYNTDTSENDEEFNEVFIYDSDDTDSSTATKRHKHKTQLVLKATKKLMNKKFMKTFKKSKSDKKITSFSSEMQCSSSNNNADSSAIKIKNVKNNNKAVTLFANELPGTAVVGDASDDSKEFNAPIEAIILSTKGSDVTYESTSAQFFEAVGLDDTSSGPVVETCASELSCDEEDLDALTAKMFSLKTKKRPLREDTTEDELSLDELTTRMHKLTKKVKRVNAQNAGKVVKTCKKKISKLRKKRILQQICKENSNNCEQKEVMSNEPDFHSIKASATHDLEKPQVADNVAPCNINFSGALTDCRENYTQEQEAIAENKQITTFFKKVTKAAVDLGRDKCTVTVKVDVHHTQDYTVPLGNNTRVKCNSPTQLTSLRFDPNPLSNQTLPDDQLKTSEYTAISAGTPQQPTHIETGAVDLENIEFHGAVDLDGTEDHILPIMGLHQPPVRLVTTVSQPFAAEKCSKECAANAASNSATLNSFQHQLHNSKLRYC